MKNTRSVPSDVLREIFTDEVRRRLASRRDPSQSLLFRLNVLSASGPSPSDPEKAAWLRLYREKKAAWDAYLTAAFALGLFDGEHGNDLRARLTSSDDDNFRSGMGECVAAWFLAGKMKFDVEPRPAGRPGHPLELCIKRAEGDIYVEVKAPQRVRHGNVWAGNDADLIQKAVDNANKQFREGVSNLLIIVPDFRIPVSSLRIQLTSALFGENMISIPIDIQKGGPAGPTSTVFDPSGRFLRTHPLQTGKSPQPLHGPRFTRIGAILCIEEYRGEGEILHHALLAHNPYAAVPIPSDLWGPMPQFVLREGEMVWTDGKSPWI